VASKVNRPASNRNWTTTIRNAMLTRCNNDITADGLDIGGKVKVIAVTNK
jgi:hypothetical protein